MCRLAIWGQRSRARAARRCSSEVFVESGYGATRAIFPDGRGGHGVSCCPPAAVRHQDRVLVISPYRIDLTSAQEALLAAGARSVRGPFRDRLRARIVLAAAAGSANAAIAAQAGVHVDTVRKWRRRFAAAGLAGLKDAPRSGRPPVFTAADRAEATALACALPAES